MGSLIGEGNPLGEDRKNRGDWAKGQSVKTFTEEMEILYFPGCYPSFDPRAKKIATATAKILNQAGVAFGILGEKENCCGESIRKTGDEELFKRLARENIKTFVDNGVKKILVSSPHCYETFKNEYPDFMVNFEVVHITEYLFRCRKPPPSNGNHLPESVKINRLLGRHRNPGTTIAVSDHADIPFYEKDLGE